MAKALKIMRCKNCGWPNKPNETVCSKCGSPLESEPLSVDYEAAGAPLPVRDGGGLKKTLPESAVFGGIPHDDVQESPSNTVKETVCPKCGYPLRPDTVKCPNCSYVISGSQQPQREPVQNQGASPAYQRHPTRMVDEDSPAAKTPVSTRKVSSGRGPLGGTINPYMMDYQQEPAFVLQPVQRMNERKPVEAVELEGSEVILSRENTEPDNPSITSQEQAVVTHSEGKWFIEDRSEQKTTFVQATKKIELHDGDIILLGNRLFEFKEQK